MQNITYFCLVAITVTLNVQNWDETKLANMNFNMVE